MTLDPGRTVADLEELRELTGNDDGAQRVAWTDTWETARSFLRSKLDGTGATEEIDDAGNQWFTLRGASDQALLIGGHMDSVPNGGWLDGCLNVLAGVEVVRRIAAEGEPPVTVRVWLSPGRVVCTVTDRGLGFDDPFAGYVRGGGARLPEGQFGLWLARELCDELLTAQTPEGFTVRLVMRS